MQQRRFVMKAILLAAASWLILAGCAQVGSDDCKGSDWYQLGQRDGRLGAQPQSDLYAARCSVTPDSARYMEGWRAGVAARPVPSW